MGKLLVTSSPHINSEDSSKGIMLDVVIALAPAAIAGCILFGLYSALLIAVCVASAVLAEYLCCIVMKRKNSIGDLSAVVTGLILAMNLPPELPLWIAAIGSIVAIVVVKMCFGGLGHNFANPAITARIVLLVSFPTYMNTWTLPFGSDVISSATPLSAEAINCELYSYGELFMGHVPGCLGETFSLLLILGGIYLVARRVISPVTPLCFIGTVALLTLVTGGDALYAVLSGGLLLGAIFMATDYVTSPIGWKGHIIFGIGCGIITFVIRQYGNLPEGVSYSILIMNLFVPYINKLTVPKPFGWEAAKK